jgi:cell division protein FtsL
MSATISNGGFQKIFTSMDSLFAPQNVDSGAASQSKPSFLTKIKDYIKGLSLPEKILLALAVVIAIVVILAVI